ncbi:MAG: hypothetical protein Q7O66_16705 [Dehalococcoidia bacterium]|nr:hypothetical protein [Dehalococcoidia bacterium]
MGGPNYNEPWDTYTKIKNPQTKQWEDVKETHYPDGRIGLFKWDGASSDWAKYDDDFDPDQAKSYQTYQKGQQTETKNEQTAGKVSPSAVDATDQYYWGWSEENKRYEWKTNLNYDPEVAAQAKAYKQAQIDASNRQGQAPQWRPGEYDIQAAQEQRAREAATTSNQRWGQEFAQTQEAADIANQHWGQQFTQSQDKNAWEKQYQQGILAQQQRDLEQKKMDDAWKTAMQMMTEQRQAAEYAPLPGQQYLMGYEPGGVQQNIARLSGRQYNAEQYRAPIITYDPQAAWQRAFNQRNGS